MASNKTNRIAIGVFLSLLVLFPASYAVTGKVLHSENRENRKYADWPNLTELAAVVPENLRKSNEANGMETVCEPLMVAKVASSDYTKGVEQYYNDRIPYKNQLNGINAGIKNRLGIGQTLVDYMTYGNVIIGKDDWLFHNGTGIESTMADYMKVNLYKESKLQEIAAGYQALSDRYKAEGREFLLYIPTNKEQIYSEYMPDNLIPSSGESRTDQLVDYLHENTDVHVIYNKEALLDAKTDAYPIFYQYDSHWNPVGGFIGEQLIRKELTGESTSLSDLEVKKTEDKEPFDLAAVAGYSPDTVIPDEWKVFGYKDDVEVEKTREGVEDLDPIIHTDRSNASDPRKVLVIYHSFVYNMMEYLDKDFQSVTYLEDTQSAKQFIKNSNPDIVILEIVERRSNQVENVWRELLNP